MMRSLSNRERMTVAVAAVLSVFWLAGCTGESNPLDRNPGVYKGASDAFAKQPADDRAKVLAERFKLVQER